MKESCGNCRYFDAHTAAKDVGSCRRYPPTRPGLLHTIALWLADSGEAPGGKRLADLRPEEIKPMFCEFDVDCADLPGVGGNDWCGEWAEESK
jgi:hypothetical protein